MHTAQSDVRQSVLKYCNDAAFLGQKLRSKCVWIKIRRVLFNMHEAILALAGEGRMH